MIEETYNDFDDLFLNLNKNVLENPENYIRYRNGDSFYLDIMYLKVKKPIATLDFSFLAYTKRKFYMLLNTYVDLNSWCDFKKKINTSKSLNITFYFNQKKKKGNNLDASPCILSLVFSRENRKNKFNKVILFYRTTDICKTLYLDLFLMNKLLEDLEDIVEINSFEIISPNPFIKGYRSFWVINYLNITLNCDNYLKYYLMEEKEKLIKKPYSKFSMERKSQEYLKNNLTYEPVDIKSLNLYREET